MLTTASLLGVVTGILSLVSLIRATFNLGLVAPLNLILEYYKALLDALFGWADAPLQIALEVFGKWLDINADLDPDWNHIFVLMWLYFSSDAKTNWEDRRSFAIFSIALGGVVALTSSIAIGLPNTRTESGSLFRAAIPMIGIFAWEFIRDIWSTFFTISTPSRDFQGMTRREIFSYLVAVYAAPVLIVGLFIILLTGVAARHGIFSSGVDVGMIAIGGYVIAMAFYWLGRGFYLATFDRRPGESWNGRRLRSGSTYLGGLMLTIIIGGIIFLMMNAGLKELGL